MTDITILIVEDEAIVALDLQSRLRRIGYHVPTTALSGDVAIRQAEQIQPDLIIMDIGLIGPLDGIQVAEQILAHFSIPIVFLTAYTDSRTRQRAEALGPAAFLTKPFEDEAIANAIMTALNGKKRTVS